MKKKSNLGCGTIIALVIVTIFIIKTCSPVKTSTEINQQKEEDLKTDAYITTQYFVKDKLKAPATADFPMECTSTAVNDTFYIKSYVDAQNSFGANIRTHYTCTLHYLGGDWMDQKNWDLIDINLEQ